jgi:hypothetical protein
VRWGKGGDHPRTLYLEVQQLNIRHSVEQLRKREVAEASRSVHVEAGVVVLLRRSVRLRLRSRLRRHEAWSRVLLERSPMR